MITLHKWYPFVQPNYDVQTHAIAKRAQRIEQEQDLEAAAKKMRKAVDELDLELYNKRARVNTIELEMFANRRRFQIFV